MITSRDLQVNIFLVHCGFPAVRDYWSGKRKDPIVTANSVKSIVESSWFLNTGRRTKFDPWKSLWFFELFLELSPFEFRFTVFFTLGCAVDYWIPHLQFFQTVEGKALKETWGGHLSGEDINVTFLHPHESQLSAMRCVILNQIDSTYMICVRWFVVLCPHYSTLSSSLPSVVTRFLEKGEFSDRLCGVVL